jgi:hypothetical protein
VSLTVTKDFGSGKLGQTRSESAPGAETAMRQLERFHRVSTSFGGRFVSSIDGLSGGTSGARPVDWFYFVDGVEAPIGAADTLLHGGDSVWWDHRDWGQAVHVPAVVGQWPHPFSSGPGGKRLAVKVICGDGQQPACLKVEAVLAARSIPSARGVPGVTSGGSGLRLLVGTWNRISSDPAARLIASGPGSSGVYARPNPDGSLIALLDSSGKTRESYRAGTGLVAATTIAAGEPTWVVTGTDSAGVDAAIASLDEKSLSGKYAVVVTAKGAVEPAPFTSGGVR